MTIAPMPLISRGVPAYTNDDFSGAFPASQANDSTYGNYWRCLTAPTGNTDSGTLTQAVYLAYDLSGVSSLTTAVVVWYNDPSTGAYDPTLISNNSYNVPAAYTIDANSAAGGSLPSSGWITLATVTGNVYHSRQHSVNLTGYKWVRIRITAINGSVSNNNVQINMDVHKANGLADDWIFYGDSIAQQGFLHTDTTLPAQINAQVSNFPLMEDGGIGGFTAVEGAANIATWLALFPGKYVGLLYGTNDANQGGTYVTNFISNMTTMINAVIGAGKTVVLPKTICWGNTTNLLANAPTINTKILTLKASFPSIILGPDLYAYFSTHQSLIDVDNIHPTLPAGYVAYQNLWLNFFLNSLYKAVVGSPYIREMRHTSGRIQ